MNSHSTASFTVPVNATLVTVNNRLKQELQTQHDRQQAKAGNKTWPTADIVPWNAWLQRQYEQLVDSGFTTRILLNPRQEAICWENTVRQSHPGQSLLRPAAAARSAMQAHALCCDWRLEAAHLDALGAEETHLYLQWQNSFRQDCQHRHWITRAELPQLIIEALLQQALPLPDRLVLSGFDDHPPQRLALFEQLRQRGCNISEPEQTQITADARRIKAADLEQETRLAAAWASSLQQKAPHTRIAIVSPELEKHRTTLQRIMTQQLNPANYLPGHPRTEPLFNISLGQPLSDFPLVGHALLALRLLSGPLPLMEIGALLRSPFLGGHKHEWGSRAALDLQLRRDGRPMLELSQLARRAANMDEASEYHCPLLLNILRDLQTQREQLGKEIPPVQWAGHLLKLMALLGWPGDHSLDSHEYQQAERFRQLISEFSALGLVQQKMRLTSALSQLRQLADETVFQPQSKASNIQVLGSLEAAGLSFDALWLLGMDDRSWPAAPRPNPLLPSGLQREYGMPHASAERELEFSRALSKRLLASAPVVVVSHAERDGDQELRPSPLFTSLPCIGIDELGLSGARPLHQAVSQPVLLEDMPADHAGAPVNDLPGGSGLLASQAACPFQALARFRLRAQTPVEPTSAPDGLMAGNLVHDVLLRIWQRLQNSRQLHALDDDALKMLVSQAAGESLADLGRKRADIFSPAFIELERQRLQKLLLDWLELEKRRDLPFEVQSLEETQQIEFNGLILKLRADRVDRLTDGRLVVIDYKTGSKVSRDSWTQARPTEPQVPLYCILSASAPAAALLAQVRRNQSAFIGLAENADIAPAINAIEDTKDMSDIGDWPSLLHHWRRSLALLAAEIRQGRADADPQEGACTYCEIAPLCRIGEFEYV